LELQRGNLTHCQKEPMKKLMILRVLYSQFNRGKRLEKGEIIESIEIIMKYWSSKTYLSWFENKEWERGDALFKIKIKNNR